MHAQTTYSRDYIDGLCHIITDKTLIETGKRVYFDAVSGDGHSFDDKYEERVEYEYAHHHIHSFFERRKARTELVQLQHTDIVKQDINDYVAARLNEIDAPRKEAIKAFLTHPAFWFVAIGGSITGVSYIYKWYIER